MEQLTNLDLCKMFAAYITESTEIKQNIEKKSPDYLHPYIGINPWGEESSKEIIKITSLIHPENRISHPKYIQELIDIGLLDTDGKTVLAKSLEKIAHEILKMNIEVTNHHLMKFINGKTNKPYSKQAINHAIEYANAR